MILDARAIKKPRKRFICDWCERPITGPHVYLYGGAGINDVPSAARVHAECCGSRKDPKVAAALAKIEKFTHESLAA